jgi:peptidoglycan hydrolase-like protein with peptidoglycan-binding domain
MSRNEAARHLRARGSLGLPAIAVAGAVIVAAGAGAAIIATQHNPGRTRATLISTRGTTAHHAHHKVTPPAPLGVVSVSPVAHARVASWTTPVTVQYSQPLASSSPLPRLVPAVPGSWDRLSSKTLQFQPDGSYVPYSRETVIIPATSRSNRGVLLGRTIRTSFTVQGASVLRLQELLAELGYLPLSFTPGTGTTSTAPATDPVTSTDVLPPAPGITGTTVVAAPSTATATTDGEPSVASDIPLQPLRGTFQWRFPHIPASLSALWQAGAPNVITTGAVMAFENANGLATDGDAGPAVWRALLRAAAAHAVTSAPYDYVYVSTGSPEYVTVWRDGVNVFTTLANTGIPQAPTAAGTWPVYARYVTTTMSGTNPDGSYYSDPGIPWVSYFNGGDALHGFLRAQYGFPQSLGCVEMPFSSAATVWPYTPLGTLVTVQ